LKSKTKIIATLGPASASARDIKELIDAGADVLRINFSHGTDAFIQQLFDTVNELRIDYPYIAILADLEGPKIRVGEFEGGSTKLIEGQTFILDTGFKNSLGNNKCVYLDYKTYAGELAAGDILLLDDGNIKLEVQSTLTTRVNCKVIDGGILSNRKGINKKGGGLSAEAIGPKDLLNIVVAHQNDADYIAVSFVKSYKDVHLVREKLNKLKSGIRVISKIERVEALSGIEKIIEVSDGIMIARGDLGIEIGYAKLTGLQKQLIKLARSKHKIAITATQMMESMIHNKSPTRAEVSDVANAVMDGTDAVMLSAETAIGSHPKAVISVVGELCVGAEEYDQIFDPSNIRLNERFDSTEESIAMASIYIASHIDIRAILSLTQTGQTVHWMSRQLSKIPIYGLTNNIAALRRMSLFRGVIPLFLDGLNVDFNKTENQLDKFLSKTNTLKSGDLVVLTCGDILDQAGGTNQLKIVSIP
jgi:pyruvate kinase